MRLLLDTNVVASGLLWNGAPAQLLESAKNNLVELCSSRILLAELARMLRRDKFSKAVSASDLTVDDLVLGYVELVTLITPLEIPPTILADPDDDHVLACAIAAQADYIVSGDRHLRDLKSYQGIRIVAAADAVATINPS
jgi:uncharacterized protein